MKAQHPDLTEQTAIARSTLAYSFRSTVEATPSIKETARAPGSHKVHAPGKQRLMRAVCAVANMPNLLQR